MEITISKYIYGIFVYNTDGKIERSLMPKLSESDDKEKAIFRAQGIAGKFGYRRINVIVAKIDENGTHNSNSEVVYDSSKSL